MLVVSQAQLDRFSPVSQQDRVSQIASHLRRLIPTAVGDWSETGLQSEIQCRMGDAAMCGFKTDYNIITYMAAVFLMGEDWVLADTEAAAACLDPISDETTRADRLDARLVSVARDRICPWTG